MRMRDFIRDNREELKAYVRRAVPNGRKLTSDELEMWIMNDETLYNWALSCGVKI